MEYIFIYHLPFSCLCTLLKSVSLINLVTFSMVLKKKKLRGEKAARALLKGESGSVKRSIFKLPSKLCLSTGTGENYPQVVIWPGYSGECR